MSLTLIFAVLALIFGSGWCIREIHLRGLAKKLRLIEDEMMRESVRLEMLGGQQQEMQSLKAQQAALMTERTEAVTQKNELQNQVQAIKSERDKAIEDKERMHQEAIQARKEAALAQQSLEDNIKKMQDWEKQQEVMEKNAKAALLSAGAEMSSKLLADHKAEAAQQKAEQAEKIQQTTEQLFAQFKNVSETVFSLKEDNQSTRGQMDKVMRALSNPGGAGQMAEVGLENLLKNIGLEPERDFKMQYHIASEEKSLRPDAVIFLPQNMVIVVDSKASKFLFELAEAEGTEREAEVKDKLRKTMQEHERALCSKDYKSAIQQSYREAGREGAIGHIYNVMYVPSSRIWDHVMEADPEFSTRLNKSGLLAVCPRTLPAICMLAKERIAEARQFDNQQRIIEVIEQTIDSVISLIGFTEKIGRGIKSTASSFEDFGRSFNRNLLPKLHKLSKLGVNPRKAKSLPTPLAIYEVNPISQTIDLEAVEVEEEVRPILEIVNNS